MPSGFQIYQDDCIGDDRKRRYGRRIAFTADDWNHADHVNSNKEVRHGYSRFLEIINKNRLFCRYFAVTSKF